MIQIILIDPAPVYKTRMMARFVMRTVFIALVVCFGCDRGASPSTSEHSASAKETPAVSTPTAQPRKAGLNTVVDVALGSKDHTTLVSALTRADYVDSLDNPGPFTVFAPTNAAFEKLPAGTVDKLMKAEKSDDLRNILKYHVTVSVYEAKKLTDGQVLGMANGTKVTVHVRNGKVMLNDATVVASVPASNGIVHVIDGVLLPPATP